MAVVKQAKAVYNQSYQEYFANWNVLNTKEKRAKLKDYNRYNKKDENDPALTFFFISNSYWKGYLYFLQF